MWNQMLDNFHRRSGDVPVQMVFCMTGWNGMSDGCRRTRVSVARASVNAWCRAGHDAKNARACPGASHRDHVGRAVGATERSTHETA